MEVVKILAKQIGVQAACAAMGVPRSTYYRACQLKGTARGHTTPSRALKVEEQEAVVKKLNSERFQDKAPREVYATLLDEGQYLCNWRTMYRILHARREVRERRNQLRHPQYTKPELLATRPNELWSWDITKLLGPHKWTYFYLYVILDVFSRYVPGWMIATQEAAHLAKELVAETCGRQGIALHQLTLHADRGQLMISKTLAMLLADLGVTKSHSRPSVSNDNPFSEAQFKTLKYRPDYPGRFGSLEDARNWARSFFNWYNCEHYHTGIELLTPASVHFGQAEFVIAQRQQVLLAAYERHPERFVKGPPVLKSLPKAVWINPPKDLPFLEQKAEVENTIAY